MEKNCVLQGQHFSFEFKNYVAFYVFAHLVCHEVFQCAWIPLIEWIGRFILEKNELFCAKREDLSSVKGGCMNSQNRC